MRLVKGGMNRTKTILLIGSGSYGQFQIGYIKGRGFKLRDLARIKRNGGEFSWETEYFPTLKQAITAAK